MSESAFPRSILEENRELLDRALEAASHYSQACGVPCSIYDAEGKPYRRREEMEDECCGLCGRFQNSPSSPLNCRELHLYGAFQAERFGGSYIYFCSVSLIHWASPLIYDGKTVGSMIGGPVMIIGKDEVIEEIKRKNPAATEHLDTIQRELETVPQVSTEQVKSLAELLLMSASWISSPPSALSRQRESLNLQKVINEEIQDRKKSIATGGEVPAYPIEKERELLAAIRGAEKQTSRKILNELLGAIFFSSGGRFEIVKFRTLELLVLLSRAAMEGGADPEQSLTLNLRYIRDIDKLQDIDELSYWLGKVLNRFINLVFTFREVKHLSAIERAIRHIQLSFTQKVSLNEVAEEAGLSPAYFSTIFKTEMGVSFSEYVNRLRVGRAKNLLSSSSLGLSEIAGRCGFEDQSYFSRIFKRIAGISPGRYRETGGRISEERIDITEQ